MQTKTIDGGVRDKAHAQAILDAVEARVPPGTMIRVTAKLVRFDMSQVRVYNKRAAETERGTDEPVQLKLF